MPSPLCSATICDRNKRVAAIGGANAYSRPDRLSFVTSFTVSNDTHCFWTPSSYANRAPGTDSLYYSSFPTLSPRPPPILAPVSISFSLFIVLSLSPFPHPLLLFSISVTLARSISSSSRCAPVSLSLLFLCSLSRRGALVATVKFDLLGLSTTSLPPPRWKCPIRGFTGHLLRVRGD